MALTVLNNLSDGGIRMSDNASFRRVYEDHLELIRNSAATLRIPVTGKQLDVHQFNWIGLLNELNQPQKMHWFIMRLNDSANWTDLSRDISFILLPDFKFIESIYAIHISSSRNSRTI